MAQAFAGSGVVMVPDIIGTQRLEQHSPGVVCFCTRLCSSLSTRVMSMDCPTLH